MTLTEQEYVTLQNRIRISIALECLRHVLPDAVVSETALLEMRRQLAMWEMDLFEVDSADDGAGE